MFSNFYELFEKTPNSILLGCTLLQRKKYAKDTSLLAEVYEATLWRLLYFNRLGVVTHR
jgi:hypothetical protein